MSTAPDIAVVVPCYRVGALVLDVIARIGPEVGWIFVVDDACPQHTGDIVERECRDPRVRVVRLPENLGVGGAVAAGYRAALDTPARVVVKLDGDGQMDPHLVPRLAKPILQGRADYSKGNRFHNVRSVAAMPTTRLIGNAFLSFLTKLSSGYWQLFDPTNGFTAIHATVLREIDFDRVAKRYFFESDLLYVLNQLRAVVSEMPMEARYTDEPSSLRPFKVVLPFFFGHMRNFARRLLYTYVLRRFSLASVELLVGVPLLCAGIVVGAVAWHHSWTTGTPATSGTVMLAALPIILGFQLLLSWLNYDVASEPRNVLHPLLE
jgi:glycosyltransferase involved in cell wall biosynthesis